MLAATPVAAQDSIVLAELTEQLIDADPQVMVEGAVAACLGNAGDRAAVIDLFTFAGWSGGGDGDWIELDRNDVWVTLLGSPSDFTCDISSDLDQPSAALTVASVLEQTRWPGWSTARDRDGCVLFAHETGALISITSGGQDPVCTPTNDSTIRLFMGPGVK